MHKKAVLKPGNTPAAKKLSELMLDDPRIGDNESKLADAVNKDSKNNKISQPTIHRILTGESQEPRRSTLKPIADYFGVTVEAFFASTPETDRIAEQHAPYSRNSRLLNLIENLPQDQYEAVWTLLTALAKPQSIPDSTAPLGTNGLPAIK